METVFAGFLLGLALMAISSLYPSILAGLRAGHDRVTAANLVAGLLEQARSRPWGTVDDREGAETIDGDRYDYTLTVTPSPDGTSDVKRVVARVQWGDRSLEMETRIFRFRNP